MRLALIALLLAGVAHADSSVSVERGAPPTMLAAHLALHDTLRDMLDFAFSDLDVDVTLRVDRAGSAALELRGKADYRQARLPPPGSHAPATGTGPTRGAPLRDRWTGTARLIDRAIEVRFTRWEASTPIPVDVTWRCAPETLTVEGKPVRAFSCQSAQRKTSPSGVGHHLPPYLQLALHLAPPATRLGEVLDSRTDANHASTGRVRDLRFQMTPSTR